MKKYQEKFYLDVLCSAIVAAFVSVVLEKLGYKNQPEVFEMFVFLIAMNALRRTYKTEYRDV